MFGAPTQSILLILQKCWMIRLNDPAEPVPPDPVNQVEFDLWKLNIKEHQQKVEEYSNFWSGLYNLVFGQCTQAMQECLKSHQNFQAVSQDGIGLLGIIKSPFDEFEERMKLSDPLTELKQTFYKLYQENI